MHGVQTLSTTARPSPGPVATRGVRCGCAKGRRSSEVRRVDPGRARRRCWWRRPIEWSRCARTETVRSSAKMLRARRSGSWDCPGRDAPAGPRLGRPGPAGLRDRRRRGLHRATCRSTGGTMALITTRRAISTPLASQEVVPSVFHRDHRRSSLPDAQRSVRIGPPDLGRSVHRDDGARGRSSCGSVFGTVQRSDGRGYVVGCGGMLLEDRSRPRAHRIETRSEASLYPPGNPEPPSRRRGRDLSRRRDAPAGMDSPIPR